MNTTREELQAIYFRKKQARKPTETELLRQQVERLEAENKELKAENERLDQWFKDAVLEQTFQRTLKMEPTLPGRGGFTITDSFSTPSIHPVSESSPRNQMLMLAYIQCRDFETAKHITDSFFKQLEAENLRGE